jgi:hypothetical protein
MKKVIKLTEGDLIKIVKRVINENLLITESLSIEIGIDTNELKFATPNSKNILNISKNTKYSKNKHSVISVTNNKGVVNDYLVYLLGKPFNINFIKPSDNNEILISYFTGERDELTKKAKTKNKLIKLEKLKDYVQDLLKGEKEISNFFDPVKLIKVN